MKAIRNMLAEKELNENEKRIQLIAYGRIFRKLSGYGTSKKGFTEKQF